MSLTCECGDYEPEPGHIVYEYKRDYSALNSIKSKRCVAGGCESRIRPGDTCVEIFRAKVPEHDVEIAIYGECGEVPMASHYLCEKCADIFLTLDELGFCVNPYDNMHDLVRDYNEMRKFKREDRI